MSTQDLYNQGLSSGYTSSLFQEFISSGATSFNIYMAGKKWKNFDYTAGYNAIINADKNGIFIIKCGNEWPSFDYNNASIKLISLDIMFLQAILMHKWPLTVSQINNLWNKDDGRVAYALLKAGFFSKSDALKKTKNSKWVRMISTWN